VVVVAIVAVPSITITGTQTLRGNGGCLECIDAIGDKLREYVRERMTTTTTKKVAGCSYSSLFLFF
jgi:hypothetical protein